MNEKHRPLNDYDLLEQLQDNAAMLKTIMKYLEDTSDNPTLTKTKNLAVYQDFLADIKFVQNEKTKLG